MTFVHLFIESQLETEISAVTAVDHMHILGIAFIYKEILGCLGVLAVEDKHRKEIVDNNGIEQVIMSAKLNFNKPKIIKTALGCLINLASSDDNKEMIAKDAGYYQLIYTVLEAYEGMTPLIDYTLRLILNTSDHKTAYQNYISGSLFRKLLLFLRKHLKNANIVWSSIQILRILCTSPKAV